jgi:hypothetical protein
MSDDGCGCIVALAVVGVVGYGAWAYLQPQPRDASIVDARSTTPQMPPIEEAPPTGPSATAAVPTSAPREACSVISRAPVSSSMIRSIGYCRARANARGRVHSGNGLPILGRVPRNLRCFLGRTVKRAILQRCNPQSAVRVYSR